MTAEVGPVDLAEQLVKALIERVAIDRATAFDIEFPVIVYDHLRALVRVSVQA